VLADEEAVGDLAVGGPGAQQADDLQFAMGQPTHRAVGVELLAAQEGDHAGHQGARHPQLPGHQRLQPLADHLQAVTAVEDAPQVEGREGLHGVILVQEVEGSQRDSLILHGAGVPLLHELFTDMVGIQQDQGGLYLPGLPFAAWRQHRDRAGQLLAQIVDEELALGAAGGHQQHVFILIHVRPPEEAQPASWLAAGKGVTVGVQPIVLAILLHPVTVHWLYLDAILISFR